MSGEAQEMSLAWQARSVTDQKETESNQPHGLYSAAKYVYHHYIYYIG